MSWAFFIDESGQDRRNSPYEVLAGVAVKDRDLWPLIRQISDAQQHYFGMRLFEAYGREAKANKLLNAKTFRLATQMEPIPFEDRTRLAHEILLDGTAASKERLTALAQAKVAYCDFVLRLAANHGAKIFGTMVPQGAPRPPRADALRKDYAYLFERFFYFLNGLPDTPMGYLVFDELDRSACHILLGQVGNYFVRTRNGRTRSRLIIPEPFFVHSDMTTLVQLADIVAYCMSWGLRLRGMDEPTREELAPLVRRVQHMMFARDLESGERQRGITLIRDLRPANGAKKGNASVAGHKASGDENGDRETICQLWGGREDREGGGVMVKSEARRIGAWRSFAVAVEQPARSCRSFTRRLRAAWRCSCRRHAGSASWDHANPGRAVREGRR